MEKINYFTKLKINKNIFNLRIDFFYLYFKLINKSIRFHKTNLVLTNNVLNITKSSFYRFTKKLIQSNLLKKHINDYEIILNKDDFEINISNYILDNLNIFEKHKKEFRLYIFLILISQNKYETEINLQNFIKQRLFKKNLHFRKKEEIYNYLEFLENINLIKFNKENLSIVLNYSSLSEKFFLKNVNIQKNEILEKEKDKGKDKNEPEGGARKSETDSQLVDTRKSETIQNFSEKAKNEIDDIIVSYNVKTMDWLDKKIQEKWQGYGKQQTDWFDKKVNERMKVVEPVKSLKDDKEFMAKLDKLFEKLNSREPVKNFKDLYNNEKIKPNEEIRKQVENIFSKKASM